MNKMVCVIGPTGTGKTRKALELSKDEPSILVSADSRQVYRGMDIVTGKDHPEDIIIHGIDLVNPDESCSVSVWYDIVMPEIKRAWGEGKVVIVVGGTGLYIKALTDGIPTMQVPIDYVLRAKLAALSIPKLQSKLRKLDPTKFSSMNHSDRLNPRRLIRAIEVAESDVIITPKVDIFSPKLIGLHYSDLTTQQRKIRERVLARLDLGAVEETKKLLKQYDKSIQSMSAIGYRSIIKFLEKSCNQDEMIETWVTDELAYAKRQLTWFRKQPVIWYDVNNKVGE